MKEKYPDWSTMILSVWWGDLLNNTLAKVKQKLKCKQSLRKI